MGLELQIISALLMDQLFGDPRRMPHPVKLIGKAAETLEHFFLKRINNHYIAGSFTVFSVLLATALVTLALLNAAARAHPWIGDAASIFILYTTIAAKDLSRHSRAVYSSLKRLNIEQARKRVRMLVGRDTADLDETRITSACVESVAENLVDGVIAPLFFAAIAGPPGAMLYKAINTMDSMFGYKNERYLKFGMIAARLDDLANLIPARISSLLVIISAAIMGLSPKNSFQILRRDRYNHTSPNAGHTEAAVAGALGIRLGGPSNYFGKPVNKPTIGDPLNPVLPAHILQTNRLMLISTFLGTLLFLTTRILISALA